MRRLTDCLSYGNIRFRNAIFGPGEISAAVDRIALFLERNVTSHSPFIFLLAINHPKTVIAFFGIIRANRICIPIEPGIGTFELNERLDHTPPAAVIRIDDQSSEWNFEVEIRPYSGAGSEGAGEDPDEVAMMMYTAAADGYMKAAVLTHENLLADGIAGVSGHNIGKGTLSCALVPFSHSFGLQTGIIMPFVGGGDILIAEETLLLRPHRLGALLAKSGVSHLYSVPPVYYVLSKIITDKDYFGTPVCCTSGGSLLPERLFSHYLHRFSIVIRQGYGLTEASPICTWSADGAPLQTDSLGKALSCCTVNVADIRGNECPPMEPGEIMVRGANVMKGYYKDPAATRRTLRDGWLLTGDLGRMDSDGNLFFVQTKKRMINRAGLKIYPAEVERLLVKHPRVKKASVRGEPDLISGESVVADLTVTDASHDSQREIYLWMHRNISGYKIPREINFCRM